SVGAADRSPVDHGIARSGAAFRRESKSVPSDLAEASTRASALVWGTRTGVRDNVTGATASELARCGGELSASGGRLFVRAECVVAGWAVAGWSRWRRRRCVGGRAARVGDFRRGDGRNGAGIYGPPRSGRVLPVQRYGGVPIPRVREVPAGSAAAGRGRSGLNVSRPRNYGAQSSGIHLARTKLARTIDGAERGRIERADRARRGGRSGKVGAGHRARSRKDAFAAADFRMAGD